MTPRGYGCILLVSLLIVLAVSPVTARPADPAIPVPGLILGLPGVPDIMQEKSKLQYDWVNFKQDGDKAYEAGNYEEAIKNYNQAEGMLLVSDPNRGSTTEGALAALESGKAGAFMKWGGHDAQAAASALKAKELQASANAKRQREGTGCLIVTATFGSPLANEVQLVRNFRDGSIAKSYTGSRFMPGFNAWYYSFSPQVAMYINNHPIVKPAMQVLIAPILEIVLFAQVCYSLVSFNPELATIVAIIVGSSLYGLIYIFPTVMAGVWIARKRGWEGPGTRYLLPAAVAWISLLLLVVAGVAFSADQLTTVASGLFVIATIVLVVAALSVSLSRYIGHKDIPVQE